MSTAALNNIQKFPARPDPQTLTSCQVVQVTVTISGQDVSGIAFVDQCNTIAIADKGVIVMIGHPLAVEQEVFIRHGDREVLAHVIGHSGVGNYGLQFISANPGFWGEFVVCPQP